MELMNLADSYDYGIRLILKSQISNLKSIKTKKDPGTYRSLMLAIIQFGNHLTIYVGRIVRMIII